MADGDTAEQLLAAAGFDVVDTGAVTGTSEFPDAEIAYRALASTGMIYPIAEADQKGPLRARCMDILHVSEDGDSFIRVTGQFGWAVAKRV